jgi:Putative Ig domain
MNGFNRRIAQGAAATAVTGGLIVAFAGMAGASTPSVPPAAISPAAPTVSGSDSTVCTSSYDTHGASIDMSVYNGTGQTLTLVPALTGHNGISGHWGTQPPATLAPGQCADVTGYSDNPVGSFSIHAVYQMSNGDFVPFTAETTGNPITDSTVFSAEPSFDTGYDTWTGQQDPAYNILGNYITGSFHEHVSMKLEGGGDTDSYQDTSSPINLAAGATSPTKKAECALGAHVRMDASTKEPIVTFQNVNGDSSGFALHSLTPTMADGSVDGITQYDEFSTSITNSGSAGTATFSWTCDPSEWGTNGDAPTFLQASPPATMPAGTPVDYRFTTLGFPAATYGVSSGQLPTGLSLDINGDLTGTPTTPGTYTFTVSASNAAGAVATAPLTITVQ